MSYCHIHGDYGNYYDGCPDCSAAEKRAESDREEIKERLSQIAYASANPGDFNCPHCKYKSLKWEATRCPLCRGEVESAYWNRDKWGADAKRLLASGDHAGAVHMALLCRLASRSEVLELVESWPDCTASEKEARRLREERKCVFCGVRNHDAIQCSKCKRWFCYHHGHLGREGRTPSGKLVMQVGVPDRCQDHPIENDASRPGTTWKFFQLFRK